jgi:hypothetical protein
MAAPPLKDWSGTITSGGTSQVAAPANPLRNYLIIVNTDNANLWVNFGIPAVAGEPSIPLRAATASPGLDGGSLVFESVFVPGQSVNVFGGTTGKSFTIKEG